MTMRSAVWKRLAWTVSIFLVIAWLSGPATAGEKIVIKAGHVLAPTEPTHVALLKWAERMKERTGGQVEMQVFASSQLGSNRDMMEQAVLGAAVISHADPGYIQDYYVDFGVLNGPFLFREWEPGQAAGLRPVGEGAGPRQCGRRRGCGSWP